MLSIPENSQYLQFQKILKLTLLSSVIISEDAAIADKHGIKPDEANDDFSGAKF